MHDIPPFAVPPIYTACTFLPSYFGQDAPEAVVTLSDNPQWLLVRTMGARNRLSLTGYWAPKIVHLRPTFISPYVDTAFRRFVVAVTDTGLKFLVQYYNAYMH